MLSAASNSTHSRLSRNDSVIMHKSGYEPSDTETEWHESPWNDAVKLSSERTRLPKDPGRNTHVGIRRQNTSRSLIREYPVEKTSNLRNNRTPPRSTEQRRQTSPYAGGKNESRKKSSRTPPRFRSSMESFSRSSIKKFICNRSTSTPKLRLHEKEKHARAPAFLGTNPISAETGREVAGNVEEDPLTDNCSQEINELIANGKGPNSICNDFAFTSTESVPTGDIFFSCDCRAPLEKYQQSITIITNNLPQIQTPMLRMTVLLPMKVAIIWDRHHSLFQHGQVFHVQLQNPVMLLVVTLK
jgi:replication factor C subunit 3/5